MSKLSEILAAKRAAEALAKQPKPTEVSNVVQRIENSPIVTEKAGENLPSDREESGGNSSIGRQTIVETVAGNGSVSGQAEPTVSLTGLKAKLAERLKQNASQTMVVSPNTNDAFSAPKLAPSEETVQARVKTEPNNAQDRHAQVGSPTGVIDGSELRKNLDFLAANIEQQELVRQVVATIAIQLRQNPALKEYMKDADVDLVVRGLRRSYNVAKRAKTEKAETKTKKKQVDLDLDKMLGDMGIDLKL